MRDLGIIFAPAMVRAILSRRKSQTRRLAWSRTWAGCKVGTLLWLRERWYPKPEGGVWYDANGPAHGKPPGQPWRSPLYLAKSQSRIQLEVTAVRVEPLQAIGEEDAAAEGIDLPRDDNGLIIPAPPEYIEPSGNAMEDHRRMCGPRAHFAAFWDTLHDRDGESWADNPEVVVLTFKARRLGELRP